MERLWTGIILDETRTRTAFVENLSNGFLLYDAEDRLICGTSFPDMFPLLRDVAVPGAHYQESCGPRSGTLAAALTIQSYFDYELHAEYPTTD